MFNSSERTDKPDLQFIITKTWTCLHPNVGYFNVITKCLGCRVAQADSDLHCNMTESTFNRSRICSHTSCLFFWKR